MIGGPCTHKKKIYEYHYLGGLDKQIQRGEGGTEIKWPSMVPWSNTQQLSVNTTYFLFQILTTCLATTVALCLSVPSTLWCTLPSGGTSPWCTQG